ncbi:Uncharacterized protein FWK35_00021436, partial [Aphis craccivora]
TKIILASKRRFIQIALTDKQSFDHTTNEYNIYLIRKNIIRYLSSICNKLTSIKVSNYIFFYFIVVFS